MEDILEGTHANQIVTSGVFAFYDFTKKSFQLFPVFDLRYSQYLTTRRSFFEELSYFPVIWFIKESKR